MKASGAAGTPSLTPTSRKTPKSASRWAVWLTKGPQRREGLSRRPGRFGRRADLGRYDLVEDERQNRHRGQRGERSCDEPRAKVDLHAVAAGDLGPQWVRGHGRVPERRGDRQARHPREHEEAAEPPAARLTRPCSRGLGDGQDERV